MQTTCDGPFFSVISLQCSISRAVHPCPLSGHPISLFTFGSKLNESMKMMACVVWLLCLEQSISGHGWLLPPPLSSWRLIMYRLHCLHGWWLHLAWQWSPILVFGNWAISVRYEILHFADFFYKKLDPWLLFPFWTFLAVPSQIFRQRCWN